MSVSHQWLYCTVFSSLSGPVCPILCLHRPLQFPCSLTGPHATPWQFDSDRCSLRNFMFVWPNMKLIRYVTSRCAGIASDLSLKPRSLFKMLYQLVQVWQLFSISDLCWLAEPHWGLKKLLCMYFSYAWYAWHIPKMNHNFCEMSLFRTAVELRTSFAVSFGVILKTMAHNSTCNIQYTIQLQSRCLPIKKITIYQ